MLVESLERRMLLTGVIFSEDFESGDGGFTVDNSGGTLPGLWHRSVGRYADGLPNHSPNNNFYYGQFETATGGGRYDLVPFDHQGVLISPPIQLDPSSTLTFNYLLQTRNPIDIDFVDVSVDNGTTVTPILSRADGTLPQTGNNWLTAQADLTPFACETVQLRFSFDTGDDVPIDPEGWYVDDIMVMGGTGVCPGPDPPPPGVIQGIKYNDANTDGAFDPADGDAVLQGWSIFAYSDDGTTAGRLDANDTLVGTTTTNAAGQYSFNLAAGTYIVVEEDRSGWMQSQPTTDVDGSTRNHAENGYALTLLGGQTNAGNDFGNFLVTVPITGQKFNDLNADGDDEGGTDPGLQGWEIRAYGDLDGNGMLDAADLAAGVVASDTTDVDGNYSLSVSPGDYVVVEVLQPGWTQSHPAGSVNTIEATLGQFGHALTVVAGQPLADNDFGNFVPGSIHAYKYLDINENGQDDNDPRREGIDFTLTGVDGMGNNVSLSMTTDADGELAFEDLIPGTYTLTEDGGGATVSDIVVTSGVALVAFAGQAMLPPDSLQQEVILDRDSDGNPDLAIANPPMFDFGDSPFSESVAGDAARHVIIEGFHLGATATDAEADSQPTAMADGDDTNGVNDEDGVQFAPLVAGQQGSVTVTLTNDNNLDAVLNAWVDFDGSQVWGDSPGEQIFTNVTLNAGSNVLTFDVPADAQVNTALFSRFRLSSTQLLPNIVVSDPADDDSSNSGSPGDALVVLTQAEGEDDPNLRLVFGKVDDGEVEDHMVMIEAPPKDFGDAPDPSFPTLLANDGARHVIVAGFHLGDAIDAELDGQPTSGADGDDNNGTPDDEDGVVFGNLVAGQQGSVTVTLTNTAGVVDPVLNAWIDFNGDGDWNDANEQVFTNEALSTGANGLTFQIPADAVFDQTLISRFRLSSQTGLAVTGETDNGEVEDHALIIEPALDFGDAPDPPYPTLLASDGARHAIVPGFSLGATVDAETDGQPTPAADGDDINGTPDDEDGVVFGTPLVAGQQGTVEVVLTNTAGIVDPVLNAWIDFNNDGDWTDAGEQVFSDQSLASGANNLTFQIPADAAFNETLFSRFRLSSTTGLALTGETENGEVEDHTLMISPSLDFGDAADPTFPTLLANDGARHAIVPGFSLGAEVDAETDGQPTTAADGDDTNPAGAADDEDGVVFGTLVAGQDGSVDVTLTNDAGIASPVLNAWVDFNGDGDWEDAGEQIFANQALSIGANNLTFSIPAGATFNATLVSRFRLSSATGLGVTGSTDDGEVEDHTLTVNPALDFGDAADPTFPTLLANDGARHAIVEGFNLGAAIDAEPDGFPSGAADGDDNNNVDDEDGIVFGPLVAGQQGSVEVTLTNTAGITDPLFSAWIDFNADGDWDDANEQVFTNQPLSAGTNSVTFPIPLGATFNETLTSRFRLSSTADLGFTGAAVDGEVEDHTLTINPALDFGDAPDPTFPTLLANDGARHAIVEGFHLGAAIDAEVDGLQSAAADGDDNDGTPDDEDGVLIDGVDPNQAILTAGQTQTFEVTLTNSAGENAFLNAWIDFDRDGTWESGERIFTDQVLSGGLNQLPIEVPVTGIAEGLTYARFRMSSQIGLTPNGNTNDGEVEDYLIEVALPNASITGLKFNDLDADGIQDSGELGLQNWTIQLFDDTNSDGRLDSAEFAAGPRATTVTDANGIWTLDIPSGDLDPPLDLIVVEVMQNGFRQTPVLGPAMVSGAVNDNPPPQTVPAFTVSSELVATGIPSLGERGYSLQNVGIGTTVTDVDFGNVADRPITKRLFLSSRFRDGMTVTTVAAEQTQASTSAVQAFDSMGNGADLAQDSNRFGSTDLAIEQLANGTVSNQQTETPITELSSESTDARSEVFSDLGRSAASLRRSFLASS